MKQGKILALTLGMFVVLSTSSGYGAIQLSNLGFTLLPHTSVGADPANGGALTYVGQSFVTGATASDEWELNSIAINFYHTNPNTTPPFVLSVYDNSDVFNQATPGALFTTLSGNDNPQSAGTYTYTASGSVLLNANTEYWIIASAVNSTAIQSGYLWSGAPGNGTEFSTQASGWSTVTQASFARSATGLAHSWSVFSASDASGNASFAIDASPVAVPEPPTTAAALCGSLGIAIIGALRKRWEATEA